MSDAPQGEGWWLASDGRWYPPQGETRPPPPTQPTMPAPPYPQTYAPATLTPGNGLAVAALVLGIVGVVFGFIPFASVVALICGVLAFTFGLVGRGRPGRRGMATAGTALGAIAVVMAIVGFFLIADTVNDVDDAFEDLDEQIDEGIDDFQDQQAEEDRDVVLEDCVERNGRMVGVLRVTNNSSERSDYSINVTFSDGDSGDLIATRSTTVDDLAPGQGTDAEVVSVERVPEAGFECDVGSVDRFAST